MTYTGYNQEDSVLINESAIQRGLFLSAHLKTYKEEEKKNQNSGDEEKFCIPNEHTTVNYKLANYSKLGSNGIIKENTRVTANDVIIGKVIPYKKNKNKEHIYKDNSIILKSNEVVQFLRYMLEEMVMVITFVKFKLKMNVIHKLVINSLVVMVKKAQ